MRHITSANLACGGHAGDAVVMREAILMALEHNVAIGAHPSFVDRDGFGRREMTMAPEAIEALVRDQVWVLADVARAEGARLTHVKPHGALYNMAARERPVADAIARAIVALDPALVLFGLAGSELIRAGEAAGLRTAREVFADRAYRPDGSLVPRSEPGAVIEDADRVVEHAIALSRDADTICVHGDTHGAAALAARIRQALGEAGIEVKAVTAP